jgi:ATP-dependent Lhr-like helicase
VSAFEQLHPALQYHVVNTLGWRTLRPTQLDAIAPVQAGRHCLLLAPTAGGKTEAAAIPVLSRMLTQQWPATSVLYICPIKALLNNLEQRLTHYAGLVGRRVEVWHGDVTQSRKRNALKDPPDILLTTPESIEAMLISARLDSQTWFGQVRTVIVDELHAFASDDRGWHLRAVLHRLDQYLPQPAQRIGLSATVSNPDELLAWFAPRGERTVVGTASVSTDADVTIDHVGSLENAALVATRLYRGEKRLVFCDSRSSAEQLSSMLRAQGVRTFISHASLSASERRLAETAFADEKDCVIVATSTLELGIDVGDLDRVLQIDAPSTVSSFLQRMGRSGRRAGSRRSCLFLTTTDDALLLALGITQKWSEAWVEAALPPAEPWHIVAQQAMTTCLERGQLTTHELIERLSSAFPELAHTGVQTLVDHMVEAGYLHQDAQVISVGPQMEKSFGRGHYRDLLASFSGSLLLTGRFGSAELGFIDPTMVSGETPARTILLGGRSWHVKEVDWSKRIVWLEPAKEGGKARWMGGARTISESVSQAILNVLRDGACTTITLSKRAKTALAHLVDEIPIPSGDNYIVIRREGREPQTWTYRGTHVNRRLAITVASSGGTVPRADALHVNAEVPFDLKALEDASTSLLALADLDRHADATKFSECLPGGLLARVISVRHFGNVEV